MIRVENLSKHYGPTIALDEISFEVHSGEILGLLGPNGAGKTSTLECLEGLREPTGGSIHITGLDPWKENRKLRNIIGVQLQSAGFPESISPKEAMEIFCAYHGNPARIDLLERFGLSEKKNSQYFELSSGQQRRLSLALAVAHNPQVLFLDEPTAGLDVSTRIDLHNLIRELKGNNTTIVMATHDMAEAEELSDRVAILFDGKIGMIGTPLEITSQGTGFTKISVRSKNDSLAHAGGSFPAVNHSATKDEYRIFFSTDIGPTVSAIIDFLQKQVDTLIDLRVERPSLEDRFLEITHTNIQRGAFQ